MHSKTVALFLSLGLTSTLAACGTPANKTDQAPPATPDTSPTYQKTIPDTPATNPKAKEDKPAGSGQSKESGEGGESGT